jgi:hypothetical protein
VAPKSDHHSWELQSLPEAIGGRGIGLQRPLRFAGTGERSIPLFPPVMAVYPPGIGGAQIWPQHLGTTQRGFTARVSSEYRHAPDMYIHMYRYLHVILPLMFELGYMYMYINMYACVCIVLGEKKIDKKKG